MEEFLYSMHHFLSSSTLEKACTASSSYRLRSLSLCLRRPCSSSSPSLPSLLPLLFPRLEELSFHSLHPSLLPLLPDLSTLPLLTSLLVGGVPLFNLRPLLLPLGPRLLRLSLLSYGSTTGRIDLSLLAHACPNLTHLSLRLAFDAVLDTPFIKIKMNHHDCSEIVIFTVQRFCAGDKCEPLLPCFTAFVSTPPGSI